MEQLETLLSREIPRGSGGKFITVHPTDQFRVLAKELHHVTEGLAAPRILSDRVLRPGSVVQYRCGAFSAPGVFTSEGVWESCLATPDGSHVKDERLGWLGLPSWAVLPLPCPPPAVPTAPTVDIVALGVTLFYTVTGVDPVIPDDTLSARPFRDRLAVLVETTAETNASMRVLAPLVLALVEEESARRWTLEQARAFLTTTAEGSAPDAAARHSEEEAARRQRLLEDGLAHVVRVMDTEATGLWQPGPFGADGNRLNVQCGAAGVLAVLTRACQLPGYAGDSLHATVHTVAEWIDERRFDVPRILPGLYFGRAGTAWALFDAARFPGDWAMEQRALDLARRLPVPWPNPDTCHGMTGAGMTMLHLWRESGEEVFRSRAIECANTVLAAAEVRDDGTVWPIPADFDSKLAGLVYYGFAHGVAGARAFPLVAGTGPNRMDCLDAALAAGETLTRTAAVDGGAARSPSGEKETGDFGFQHWCSGASGIGTFLIRLWHESGDERLLTLCRQAAVTLHRNRWRVGISACHGLAGDGEYLLDLADFTLDVRCRERVEGFATVLYARHAIHDDLMVTAGEDPTAVTVEYNSGASSALGFLVRLQHGGLRWRMAAEPPASMLGAGSAERAAACR